MSVINIPLTELYKTVNITDFIYSSTDYVNNLYNNITNNVEDKEAIPLLVNFAGFIGLMGIIIHLSSLANSYQNDDIQENVKDTEDLENSEDLQCNKFTEPLTIEWDENEGTPIITINDYIDGIMNKRITGLISFPTVRSLANSFNQLYHIYFDTLNTLKSLNISEYEDEIQTLKDENKTLVKEFNTLRTNYHKLSDDCERVKDLYANDNNTLMTTNRKLKSQLELKQYECHNYLRNDIKHNKSIIKNLLKHQESDRQMIKSLNDTITKLKKENERFKNPFNSKLSNKDTSNKININSIDTKRTTQNSTTSKTKYMLLNDFTSNELVNLLFRCIQDFTEDELNTLSTKRDKKIFTETFNQKTLTLYLLKYCVIYTMLRRFKNYNVKHNIDFSGDELYTYLTEKSYLSNYQKFIDILQNYETYFRRRCHKFEHFYCSFEFK